MKKKFTILIALLLTVSLLAGCGGTPSEKIQAAEQKVGMTGAVKAEKEAEETEA